MAIKTLNFVVVLHLEYDDETLDPTVVVTGPSDERGGFGDVLGFIGSAVRHANVPAGQEGFDYNLNFICAPTPGNPLAEQVINQLYGHRPTSSSGSEPGDTQEKETPP